MNEFPKLVKDIEINTVEDGYIIYQSEKDKVHYLNNTAVVILECCTGENTREQIEKIFQDVFDLPEAPKAEVDDCLKNLFDEGLIQ